jgi:hypothetical protein
VSRPARPISSALREVRRVMNQTIQASSPGALGMRPIGRAFACPFSAVVTAQQNFALAMVSFAAVNSRSTDAASDPAAMSASNDRWRQHNRIELKF